MKYQISTIIALCGAAVFTSCEDMLSPESDMVTYQEDHTLKSANDTLYSVMGVVSLMQHVADRTNLLGEVRGDLVNITSAATTDLQELAANMTSTSNVYNQPKDYYAIINNCNYFIQYADMSKVRSGRKIFEREMAAMHTFRAWAYLQLATTYGEVPFYTEFLGTQEDANLVLQQPRQNLQTICNFLIEDLQPFITTYELDYGNMSAGSTVFQSHKFFIPVRVMLGELCLWSGRYQEAAQYYHDWLTDIDNPRTTEDYSCYWDRSDIPSQFLTSGSYITSFLATSDQVITYIPMEENIFDGPISQLPNLYNSTTDNYYYNQLTYSEQVVQLSASQSYCYVYSENGIPKDTVYQSADSIVSKLNDRKQIGDVRLYAVLRESALNQRDKRYNDTYITFQKFLTSNERLRQVILYRQPVIYLHYAEALNRAGFPTAAFAILKYGLSLETTQRTNGDVIDARERESAGTLISFNNLTFNQKNTFGSHSRGCGDTYADTLYVIPQPAAALASYADTVAFQQPLVEDLIIEELGLETCFEGQRYYDLLRIAQRRGDAAYLADRIARRNGTVDEALRSRLMEPKNWYLPLP